MKTENPCQITAIIILVIFLKTAAFLEVYAQGIITVSPAQNALNIPRTTTISVTFDQPMNQATINDSTFRVWGMQSGLHRGAITYDGVLRKATLKPTRPFAYGEIVSTTLTSKITTSGGQPIGKFEWQFATNINASLGKFITKGNYQAGNNPTSIFSADLDGDGDSDLAVTNYGYSGTSKVSVLKNDGYGIFQSRMEYNVGRDPNAVFAVDLDRDLDVDLAVACDDTISILKNNGAGIFFKEKIKYSLGGQPRALFASDLNGDGDIDLVMAAASYTLPQNNFSIVCFKNKGDGSFQKADYYGNSSARAVFAADFDGNGNLDLAVVHDGYDRISILKNKGDGSFESNVYYEVEANPISIFAADLDIDGDVDLAIASSYYTGNKISILKNKGDGTFLARAVYYVTGNYQGDYPQSIFASDLDGDKDIDLITTNSSSNTILILKNTGNGAFQADPAYKGGGDPRAVFASDLDGDGALDLATTNSSSNNVSILMNRGFVSTAVSMIQFGQVYVGYTKDLSFYIYNESAGSVSITNIVSSNKKFVVTSKINFSIAQKDSAIVIMRYAPSGVAMSDTGTVMIYPSNNSPMRIYLKGAGIPPTAAIAVSTPALDFGNMTTTKTADLIFNISNAGVLDLNIKNIIHTNPNFSVLGGVTHTIQPSEIKSLAMRFTPSLIGNQSDTLKIFSNDAANNPVRISIKGNGTSSLLPEISVRPLQLKFDSIRVGYSKSLKLKIYNRGAAYLNISDIKTNNNKFVASTATNFTLSPNDSADVMIKFSPIQPGAQAGTLSIMCNDQNENPLNIQMIGMGNTVVGVKSHEQQMPKEHVLYQNYPNPFNPETTIHYELPNSTHVTLSVYNVHGQEVAVLVNQEKPAGKHQVQLNASNLTSGVYFYRIHADNFIETKKLLLIR